jgi:predicted amidohydrolase YtcJ
MRIYAMASSTDSNFNYFKNSGKIKTDRLNVRSFKFYADGALGSRGACLLNDYQDQKGWKGFLLSDESYFREKAKWMLENGFQMNTHCIGDSSDRIISQIYFETLNSSASKDPLLEKYRWRIEHAQVVNKVDLQKFSYLIPSVQPTHATSDMYWAEERLGERVTSAYSYKDLLNVSGILALGTDFPVEDISPIKTFYAAVARKDAKGFPTNGFQMENALSRADAIRGMTIWAAYSNFEETEKGSIEKGKYADFVVLDRDLMKINENEILNTRILFTFLNGEKVFHAD